MPGWQPYHMARGIVTTPNTYLARARPVDLIVRRVVRGIERKLYG